MAPKRRGRSVLKRKAAEAVIPDGACGVCRCITCKSNPANPKDETRVQCDQCDGYFHLYCEEVSVPDVSHIDSFYCRECTSTYPEKVITYVNPEKVITYVKPRKRRSTTRSGASSSTPRSSTSMSFDSVTFPSSSIEISSKTSPTPASESPNASEPVAVFFPPEDQTVTSSLLPGTSSDSSPSPVRLQTAEPTMETSEKVAEELSTTAAEAGGGTLVDNAVEFDEQVPQQSINVSLAKDDTPMEEGRLDSPRQEKVPTTEFVTPPEVQLEPSFIVTQKALDEDLYLSPSEDEDDEDTQAALETSNASNPIVSKTDQDVLVDPVCLEWFKEVIGNIKRQHQRPGLDRIMQALGPYYLVSPNHDLQSIKRQLGLAIRNGNLFEVWTGGEPSYKDTEYTRSLRKFVVKGAIEAKRAVKIAVREIGETYGTEAETIQRYIEFTFEVNLDADALKTVIAAALKNLTHRKLLMEINGRYKLSAKTDLADEDETQEARPTSSDRLTLMIEKQIPADARSIGQWVDVLREAAFTVGCSNWSKDGYSELKTPLKIDWWSALSSKFNGVPDAEKLFTNNKNLQGVKRFSLYPVVMEEPVRQLIDNIENNRLGLEDCHSVTVVGGKIALQGFHLIRAIMDINAGDKPWKKRLAVIDKINTNLRVDASELSLTQTQPSRPRASHSATPKRKDHPEEIQVEPPVSQIKSKRTTSPEKVDLEKSQVTPMSTGSIPSSATPASTPTSELSDAVSKKKKIASDENPVVPDSDGQQVESDGESSSTSSGSSSSMSTSIHETENNTPQEPTVVQLHEIGTRESLSMALKNDPYVLSQIDELIGRSEGKLKRENFLFWLDNDKLLDQIIMFRTLAVSQKPNQSGK